MRRGAYMNGGLIRGVTQASIKRWAYLWRPIRGRGGAYRRRNTVHGTPNLKI